MQRTLVLIKPDAFCRNMVAKIMRRIELKGYTIAQIKFWNYAPLELIQLHYEQDKDKPYFDANCSFMTSGPIVSIVYEGDSAISGIRNLQGSRTVPGTIRGDYVTDIRRNLIHASDSEESAAKEIKLWFPNY